MEDDTKLNEQNDMLAEGVYAKYPEAVQAFESASIPAAFGESVTSSEIAALGHQLDKFESMCDFLTESGTLGDLGELPKVGLDIKAINLQVLT